METVDIEQLASMLQRVGLRPSAKEMERLRSLVEHYKERLRVLHSVEVGEDGVAGVFRAEWTSEKETTP